VSWEVSACLFPDAETKVEIESLSGEYEPAWYTTLNSDQTRPAWFLARSESRLIGYLTVFDPSGTAAEVSAFVIPGMRGRGVFRTLLLEARRRWDAPGRNWLLVVERSDVEGCAVASHWGKLAFTESTLTLAVQKRPAFPGFPEGITLTDGRADDLEEASEAFRLANGEEGRGHRDFLERILVDPDRRFLVLREASAVVGVGCLHQDNGKTMVHGLVIRPDRQGRGLGRLLVQALLDQGAPGTDEFLIEVDSTNTRAENLYRSLGFTDQRVTDYYEV